MNTSRTDHEPYQWEMPRAELRRMLIDAQQRSTPYHYDLHESRASLWECAGLTLFALLMLGGLAAAISWGLR